MSVAVVVPWRDNGCAYRYRNWEWVQEQFAVRYPDWPVVTGPSSEGPFNRSEAILRGAASCDADVLVVHDADVWFDGDLDEVVERVAVGSGWAVPHWHLVRLSAAASAAVLDGATLSADLAVAERPYKGNATGTLLVIHRSLLFSVPPDVRFVGWGQEDEAWGAALETLYGRPARGPHDLYHLWHPEPQRMNRREGNREGVALRKQYDRANRDRRGMRRVADAAVAAWEAMT